MERPRVQEQMTRQREVTGEVVYLDAMRQAGQWPEPYEAIPDMAIQLYEAQAASYRENGIRPAILDEYSLYDRPTPPLEASCIALADELLAHKAPDSPVTFVDIVAEMPAQEVLERLQRSPAGALLASDDEQLAIASDGSYYPVLDIRKSDATLTGVGVRIWGWDYEKSVFTDQDDEPYDHNKHVLVYPSDEKTRVRELQITFMYDHPASHFQESILLRVDSQGPDLYRNVYVTEYMETGYEGHAGKGLKHGKKQAVAEFADLVAEIVGDTPESVAESKIRAYLEYEQRVIIPESSAYLREWVENSWAGQVMYDLRRLRVDAAPGSDITLYEALTMQQHVQEAHTVLVNHVNNKRAERNRSARNKKLAEVFGTIEPWVDLVPRTTPPSRRAQSPQPPIR